MGMNLKVACSKSLHQLISVIVGARIARETKDSYDAIQRIEACEELLVEEMGQQIATGAKDTQSALKAMERKRSSLESIRNLATLYNETQWTERGEVDY